MLTFHTLAIKTCTNFWFNTVLRLCRRYFVTKNKNIEWINSHSSRSHAKYDNESDTQIKRRQPLKVLHVQRTKKPRFWPLLRTPKCVDANYGNRLLLCFSCCCCCWLLIHREEAAYLVWMHFYMHFNWNNFSSSQFHVSFK